jgi:hypothetical protein
MADNVAITAGTGTTIAADDVGGGVLHQRVKLTWGVDGTGTDASASNPLPVVQTGTHNIGTVTAVTAISNALPAGNNNIGDVDVATITAGETHIGEVGGKSAVRDVTLSTDTAAYASGDLIADTQQIDGFFRKTDGTGVINTLTIIDEDGQGAAFTVFFHSTTTTMGTENSAPSISDANLSAGIQGMVSVAASDWVTITTGGTDADICCIKNIGLPVKAISGTDDLYISVVNGSGTPDWDADSLKVRIGVLLD